MKLNVEHTARIEPMPLFSFEGKRPNVHPTAFIAPTAVLIGDVTIEERASVWYNAVLRGDLNPILVRAGANVQDCSVVHVTARAGVEIGRGATVGHNCNHPRRLARRGGPRRQRQHGARRCAHRGARDGRGRRARDAGDGGARRHAGHGHARQGEGAPLAGTPAEFWVKANPQGYQKLAQRHLAGIAEVPR